MKEHSAYILIIAFYLMAYTIAPIIGPALPETWRPFGFWQWGRISAWAMPFIAMGIFIIAWRISAIRIDRWRISRMIFGTPAGNALLFIIFTAIFLLLSNNFLNYDSKLFPEKFITDVPIRGAHITHDEILELYIHSKFWQLTNNLFGWDVIFSYQVINSIAGGAFVVLFGRFTHKFLAEHAAAWFLLAFTGGYIGIFFGDPENYTLTATLLMLYFLISGLYIKDKVSILAPSIVLIVAASFHLLSFFLAPSLLYLFMLEWKKGRLIRVLTSVAAMAGYFIAVLMFFHFNGLPLSDLYYHSHAMGHGGNVLGHISRPDPWYIYQMLNLGFLIAPYFVLYIPLLVWRRIARSNFNRFLGVASIMMFAFLALWRSLIAINEDWNLYAIAGLVFALHVWYNFLQIQDMKHKRIIACALFSLMASHSLSWVIANHFNLPLTP